MAAFQFDTKGLYDPIFRAQEAVSGSLKNLGGVLGRRKQRKWESIEAEKQRTWETGEREGAEDAAGELAVTIEKLRAENNMGALQKQLESEVNRLRMQLEAEGGWRSDDIEASMSELQAQLKAQDIWKDEEITAAMDRLTTQLRSEETMQAKRLGAEGAQFDKSFGLEERRLAGDEMSRKADEAYRTKELAFRGRQFGLEQEKFVFNKEQAEEEMDFALKQFEWDKLPSYVKENYTKEEWEDYQMRLRQAGFDANDVADPLWGQFKTAVTELESLIGDRLINPATNNVYPWSTMPEELKQFALDQWQEVVMSDPQYAEVASLLTERFVLLLAMGKDDEEVPEDVPVADKSLAALQELLSFLREDRGRESISAAEGSANATPEQRSVEHVADTEFPLEERGLDDILKQAIGLIPETISRGGSARENPEIAELNKYRAELSAPGVIEFARLQEIESIARSLIQKYIAQGRGF